MKSEVLKAVWPKGIPLEEYPRAVALLETVATAKHWRGQNHEGNRLHLAFPGVHGSPIGAVPLAAPDMLVTEGIRSTQDGHLVHADAKARLSALKPKVRSHCSEALVRHVAALLRAEPCTIARLCALTRKTDRPIAEARRRLGAVEAGRVFRADGSNKGTLPVAWKLPEPSRR